MSNGRNDGRRRPWTIASLLLALCGVAVIAGCGSSGSSSGSSSSASASSSSSDNSACQVLTLSIAKSSIGSTAHVTRKAQPNSHETQCVYTSAHGAASVMVGDWDFMKEFGGGTGDAADPAKKVSGIGDEAFMTATELTVRKGDRGVTITAFGQAGNFEGAAADHQNAANEALQKKIAVKILPNL